MATKHFRCVAVGGTFDHIHAGHIAFLQAAFDAGDHVFIGITTDILVHTKHYRSALESYPSRVNQLSIFLTQHNLQKRATIIPLNDMYGVAADEKDIEALLVTEETRANGQAINVKRRQHGLPPLQLIVVPLQKGYDEEVIRSTRIRRGEIDREGHAYRKLFEQDLSMPEDLRVKLRKPLGQIVAEVRQSPALTARKAVAHIADICPSLLITVGDVVSYTLSQAGRMPDIAVIDFITRRKRAVKFSDISLKQSKISNPAGSITKKAADAIFESMPAYQNGQPLGQHTITIDGEEDLLTLPAILAAPLGALVAYGQMGKGIVLVPITEQIKQHAVSLIREFEILTLIGQTAL